jgi:recombination protein RecA
MATAPTRRRVSPRSPTPPDKDTELGQVYSALRKRFGDKSIVSAHTIRQPWRIPTNVFDLDRALLGGIPVGRITMLHGPKHSGKTYMAYRIMASAQRIFPAQRVVFIDTEGTFDAVWATKCGVDVDRLVYVPPDSGEQAVDIADALMRASEVSLVVVDSLASLVPLKEQEASASDSHVAMQARLITSMLRKITASQIIERKRGHDVTALVLNQQRTKIGGWSPTGDPISLPGGKALGHFTSVELRLKNKENIKKDLRGEETLAWNDHAFTVEKCKTNGGIRTGEFRLIRRAGEVEGINEGEVDDAAVIVSVAKTEGFYTGQGRSGFDLAIPEMEPVHAANADAMIRTLNANPDYLHEVARRLIALHAQRQGMPEWFLEHIITGECATFDD